MDGAFIEKVKKTFTSKKAQLVARAYAFSAEKACGNDSTGRDAALLMIEQKADATCVAASLLAPLLWQNCTSANEIRIQFGREMEALIDDLRPPMIASKGECSNSGGEIEKILAAFRGSPRRALLFIAFRLLALEKTEPSDDAVRIAQETLDLLAPIANRLSLGDLRRRLEDACLRILEPETYEELKARLSPIRADDDKCLKILLDGVQNLLDQNGIAGRTEGRTKSLYSIWRKMKRTGRSLQEIMDRVGLRVIVTSVPDCYRVLGILHTHFTPVAGTFDDYIGLPKENGYQSIHTCVYPVREISHKPIEFQIRTELMHMEAEYGTAAHWRYKNRAGAAQRESRRAQWMKGLREQHAQAPSSEAFIDLLHRQVFQDHIIVFGNGGRIVRLGENATVRDYLAITGIRLPRAGAIKVNGKKVPPDHRLRDGDSIETPVGRIPAKPGPFSLMPISSGIINSSGRGRKHDRAKTDRLVAKKGGKRYA